MMQSQSQSQGPRPDTGLFDGYPAAALPGTFDEMFDGAHARAPFARVAQLLAKMSPDDLARAQQLAETALLQQGVTFSVYGDARGTEKIFPFCLLPRLIAAADFARIERGLQQRLRALGAFLDDIYGEQKIIAAGVVPAEMILGAMGPTLRGGRLCDIRPPDHHTLPGGVSLERLRVLDAWISKREQEPLAGAAVHDVLTHVVDEVHEICGTLGRELLGAG